MIYSADLEIGLFFFEKRIYFPYSEIELKKKGTNTHDLNKVGVTLL